MNILPGAGILWDTLGPLLIASARILPAITVAALFPADLFPALLRNSIVLSLSLAIYPHIAASMPDQSLAPLAWLALIGKEVLIGALIGSSVGILIRAFEAVGTMIDVQVGLSNAQLFDPFGGHEAGPYSSLMTRLAIVLFVVGGGMYVLVTLLLESFRLWPVASFYPTLGAGLVDYASQSLGSIAELIVRLAAPVILVLVLIDLGFGLINRVVPQLNVFFFTMPIKGVVTALMLALYLSYLVDIAAEQVSELGTKLDHLVPALGGRR